MLLFCAGPIPIRYTNIRMIIMKRFFKQHQEDAVPRQQIWVGMLHVHSSMNLDELTQRTVVIYHSEGAYVTFALYISKRSLVLTIADRREEPFEIPANFFEDAA